MGERKSNRKETGVCGGLFNGKKEIFRRNFTHYLEEQFLYNFKGCRTQGDRREKSEGGRKLEGGGV